MRSFTPRTIPCTYPACQRLFKNKTGLASHIRRKHIPLDHLRHRSHSPGHNPPADFDPVDFLPPPLEPEANNERPGESEAHIRHHPLLNGLPCDSYGDFIADGMPPPPWDNPAPDDFHPYDDRHSFELADILYRRDQMSATNIDDLMQIWGARHADDGPPFDNKQHLYDTIDSTPIGGIPWQSFTCNYNGGAREGEQITEPWKFKDFDVWYRDPRAILHNQLGNRDFKNIDVSPKQVYDKDGRRVYEDFMSGNWAWRQCTLIEQDIISEDPTTHGSTFCPIILGSDKTTVSVATGHTEYYPAYISNGLIHNSVRRSHQNGLTLLAFLAIPKADAENKNSDEFRRFRRNLFHGALRHILSSLRPAMTTPEVVRFGDGYYRRVIYGIGPYIADYPEQVLLACIVQGWCARCTARFDDLDGPAGRRSHVHTLALFDTLSKRRLWEDYGIVADILPFTHEFPRADIHELIAPDLLHQIIKGSFKDHLVTWVIEYLELAHPPPEAKRIIADIDRRIAVVPPFSGLRRFPEGRGFKQWTGDDSKALMKVYLPAIAGHLPTKMVQAIRHFLDFCYLVRRHVINEDDLTAIDAAVAAFHEARKIFQDVGVRPDGFSLPRQHSMTHYRHLIQEFGAPNGLCSSITESAHIRAVKKPWRRSNRYEALGQMLVVNQRLDKLAAARVDFRNRGMLTGSLFDTDPGHDSHPRAVLDGDGDDGAVDGSRVWGEVLLAQKP
ncbi:hypothetical protein H0H92_004667, partial [Tricholoma furcatifolium]